MSSTLQRLEAHGWIMVRPDPADGRAKRVTITASGRRARAEALLALEPVTAELEQCSAGVSATRYRSSPNCALISIGAATSQIVRQLDI